MNGDPRGRWEGQQEAGRGGRDRGGLDRRRSPNTTASRAVYPGELLKCLSAICRDGRVPHDSLARLGSGLRLAEVRQALRP